jgi:hypothetical protein
MKRNEPWQPRREGISGRREARRVKPIARVRRVNGERAEQASLFLHDWLPCVFGRKHVSEKMLVVMTRQPNTNRNARGCDGSGGAPGRLAQNRDVVPPATYIGDASQEGSNRRTRAMARHRPERVGGDHVAHMRNERSDRRRVVLAPDVDRRVGEGVVERRRECGREDQVAQIVERDKQNPSHWRADWHHVIASTVHRWPCVR